MRSKLFFFDNGGLANDQGQGSDSESGEDGSRDSMDEDENTTQPPESSASPQPTQAKGFAWADPDDDDLRISIASDKRLRKLRTDASEDVITGSEYERRLRKQYVPLWSLYIEILLRIA